LLDDLGDDLSETKNLAGSQTVKVDFPRLLRRLAGEVAEHRPPREIVVALQSRVLPPNPLRSIASLNPYRTPVRQHRRLAQSQSLSHHASDPRHAASVVQTNGCQALSMGKAFSGAESELDPSSWSAPEVLKGEGWKNYVKKGKG
jgi:hypothetical protein